MNQQAKTGEAEHSDEIFFRFEWADKDKTLNKNRWKNSGGKWSKVKGDEDRLGVTWEINRIDKFAIKGCAVLCHNESKNEKEWKDSFADVKTKGVWENGKWSLVMPRKLDTGYDDDIQFNTRKKYPFAIAVFDDAHEHNSYSFF